MKNYNPEREVENLKVKMDRITIWKLVEMAWEHAYEIYGKETPKEVFQIVKENAGVERACLYRNCKESEFSILYFASQGRVYALPWFVIKLVEKDFVPQELPWNGPVASSRDEAKATARLSKS